MLEVRELSFAYGERPVLCGVSFEARAGELLSVLGSNGVGKSTLFNCILGHLSGYTGYIGIDGKNCRDMSVRELAQKLAYIPQLSAASFNYTVEDMVLMGTTAQLGAFSSPGKAELLRAQRAMERVGIEALRERNINECSGGERQLVLMARALAQNTGILLLDEPTSALDFGNQLLVYQRMRELAAEGYTVVQTTHDPQQAYMFSDRIIALRDGKILAQGSPSEVMTAENVSRLYGVSVEMTSLHEDSARVFMLKK